MIIELLQGVMSTLGLDIGQAGLVAALLATGLYWRKAMGAASIATDWAGRLVFSAVLIGVLRLSGIISSIDVGHAFNLLLTVVDLIRKLISMVF